MSLTKMLWDEKPARTMRQINRMSAIVWLSWRDGEEPGSQSACLFPWKAAALEKRPAAPFCSKEMSQLTSGPVIDGRRLPGAVLERAA